MKWTPKIEVNEGGIWRTLPMDAFMGTVEVDRSRGEATLGDITVARSAAPANPASWFLTPVRVSYITPDGTFKLFEGQLRGSQQSPLQGVITYSCASMTKDVVVNSDAVFKQLEAAVPWSTIVFGERAPLSRREQFEKLLNASNYFVGSAGLVTLDTLVKFHKKLGEPLNPVLSYTAFHTADDVIAKDSPGGDISEPFTINFSEPKLSAPAIGTSETVVPADVVALAPVNRITCRVVHRFKRLVQERFGYYYYGGNVITDHLEVAANWLTLEALESAMAGTQMATVYKAYTHPPLIGSDITNPGIGVHPSVQGALVQTFDVAVARRYIQDCEYVYEREVRCDESIRRFGETKETMEVSVSDSTDWSGWNARTIAPNFNVSGVMEVRDEAHFSALGVKSTSTRQEALRAITALVAQASRKIKVAHAASLTNEIGSSTLISTEYKVLLTSDSALLDVGNSVAVQTSIWTVSGVVSSTVATMSPDGSAHLALTLTTNIAPAATGVAPPIPLNSVTPLTAAVGFNGNLITSTTFTRA